MYPFSRRAALAALLLLFLSLALTRRSAVRAQEAGEAVRLGRHSVVAQIDDGQGIAWTVIRQEITNTTWARLAGSLKLPIPDTAAITGCEVVDPASDGKRGAPAVQLASSGRNQYQFTLTDLPSRRPIVLQIGYSETITRRGQRRKYVYPVSAPGEGIVPAALEVEVRLSGLRAAAKAGSTTHRMTLRKPAADRLVLSYSSRQPPEGRDVVVDWSLPEAAADREGQLAVLAPGGPNREPYFLLTLPAPAALLRSQELRTQPVDLVFCVDVSGSTRGRKLNVLQEAVRDGLVDLLPQDRFAIVAFDDDARLFRRKLVSATAGGVDQAVRFVNRLRPGGGNDPDRALRAAAGILTRSGTATGRLPIVVIVTDEGDIDALAPVVADSPLRRGRNRLVILGAREDSRLVHHQLRGGRLVGGPSVALSRATVTFGPALAGAAFDAGDLNAAYVYPAPERLPPLPLSTPIVLMGRLGQPPPTRGKVLLTGTIEGKPRTVAIPYRWKSLGADSPVPALWANRRIRRLQQLAARERDDANELLAAVETVRKEHGLRTTPAP